MKQCKSPIYHVMDTIAKHSEELFMMLDDWKDAMHHSKSIVTAVTNINQDIEYLYFYDIPTSEATTAST